jgi:hypothetical protein
MTVAEGILLAICVVVFIYPGVAMFRPDRRAHRGMKQIAHNGG